MLAEAAGLGVVHVHFSGGLTDWMPEPCRSCDRREIDFGGCRCQAFLLTGDLSATDPVCHLSPDHDVVQHAVVEAERDVESWTPRVYTNSQSD